jgi:hypothetical protein
MKASLVLMAVALPFGCGCAAPGRPQAGPGAAAPGAPAPPFDGSLAARPAPAPAGGGERGPVRLPDQIELPASYRLMLLDGHLVLVRETDAQALQGAPATMRIVAGEIARGELAYQPGLLPQELAAEVAANRESSARMDNALEDVMRRSRELSGRALELQAQSVRLAGLLSAAEARIRELELAGGPARAQDPRPKPEGKAPDP